MNSLSKFANSWREGFCLYIVLFRGLEFRTTNKKPFYTTKIKIPSTFSSAWINRVSNNRLRNLNWFQLTLWRSLVEETCKNDERRVICDALARPRFHGKPKIGIHFAFWDDDLITRGSLKGFPNSTITKRKLANTSHPWTAKAVQYLTDTFRCLIYKTAAGAKFDRFLEFSVCLCFSSEKRNNIKIHEICNYKHQGKQRF